MVNRGYTPRTTRLLREFLALHYPGATRIGEFLLTKPNPEAIARAGGNVSPRFGGTPMGRIDGVVVLPHEVQIWEAGDVVTGAKIGQLEAYGQLWPLSVESRAYEGRKVTLHLLAARDNPLVRAQAEAKGIDVQIYTPAWYTASQTRVQMMAEQRALDAQAQQIIAEVVSGRMAEAVGIAELQALGKTRAEAVDSLTLAIRQAQESTASQPAS